MKPRFLVLICAVLFAFASDARAVIANAWHIPVSAQTGIPATMRDPFVEIAPTGSFTVYQGYFKNNGAGGNQNGGYLIYRNATTSGAWQSVALAFHANAPSNANVQNQFWKGVIVLGAGGLNAGANDVVQYYIKATYSDRDDTYLHGGDLDTHNLSTGTESVAQGNPYSFRNRPAWIFHAGNRVVSGSSVGFWAKVGYIGDLNSNTTRWADAGAVYFTTDGSAPAGSLGAGSGTTQVATFAYDHPEQNSNEAGSVTGAKPMWWAAAVPALLQSLPLGATIQYKIGFWHSANGEERFADFNAAADNQVFTFTNGTVGDAVMAVTTATTGTLNGNYTTTKLFVDEIAGTTMPITIDFQPGQGGVTAVEVVTNLNQRDYADGDRNANGVSDGMEFNQTESLIGTAGDFYYRSFPMTSTGAGHYALTALSAAKTGAYRLTARWKVSGDPAWRWFTNASANRRDHAITVSPVTARGMNMYEVNTLTVEAKATGNFVERSTFEDLYDAAGAPRTGDGRGFNLDYLTGLGVNWLWFQPIHPAAIEGRETDPATGLPYSHGSPYAVKNFFEVDPWMSANYNGTDDITSAASRAKGMVSFQGFVSAADARGVSVMLDSPFNHAGYDVELAQAGVDLFQRNGETWLPSDLIKNREARFFSKSGDYAARASGTADIALAPDRGDFGKWNDVKDVYFGRYDALVNQNPADNGNHLNESDRFFYAATGQGTANNPENANWTSDDDPSVARDANVTKQTWRYFARYAVHWLEKTRPAGQNRNSTPADGNAAVRAAWDARGIDGLRCDFGQGLPPQCWEYISNVARSYKWNFVMMTESLDGGAVTYRSNRHFDVLNENIVFPLKTAGNATQMRQIFEDRRTAYGQGLVLTNTTSHDEENYANIFHPLLRHYAVNAMDGAPLVFMGQELGVTRTSGFTFYETNFGKNIASFKKFNAMQPAWLNRTANAFGEKFLFDAFASVSQARLGSPALRGSNRWFLSRAAGGTREEIWAVAKYEQPNASPNFQDVVLAFSNLRTETAQSETFNVNVTQGGGNLFGIKAGRTYNVRNIAAYLGPAADGFDPTRRTQWLWGGGMSGSALLAGGVFVNVNPVPATNAAWITAPFEAQFLKLYDVTPPPVAGVPATPKAYAIGNQAVFSWTPASDPEGGISGYELTITGAGAPQVITLGNVTGYTFTGALGQTVQASIRSINNAGTRSAASAVGGGTILLSATGDADGDGVSNVDEQTAGTDPLSANSIFKITGATRPSANSFQVQWSSVPGIQYEVLASPSLSQTFTNVSGVTPIPATGTTTSYTDPSVGPRRFYKVRVVAP